MYTTKSAFTQLMLSFRNENKAEFEKFVEFTTHRAGALIDTGMIQTIAAGNHHTTFIITASAESIYMFGYDWALWQFPPKK